MYTSYQLQLMPASRSRKVLVVSPRNAISRVCILLYASSCIARRRYLNSLTLKLGLNYTCRVLRSFNCLISFYPRTFLYKPKMITYTKGHKASLKPVKPQSPKAPRPSSWDCSVSSSAEVTEQASPVRRASALGAHRERPFALWDDPQVYPRSFSFLIT